MYHDEQARIVADVLAPLPAGASRRKAVKV
jgi:hypothetical protein